MSKFAIVMLLTCGRAPLVAIACAMSLTLLAFPHPALLFAAIATMAIAAATDLFDGKYARKWGVESRLGALADPLMDKVFYAIALPSATFIALYNEHLTHAAILLALDIVSMLRDQWVTFLRSVGSEYGADVRANWSGKLRTLAGFPIVVIVHLQLGIETLKLHNDAFEGAANIPATWMYAAEVLLIAITLLSAASYTRQYMPYLRRAAQHK